MVFACFTLDEEVLVIFSFNRSDQNGILSNNSTVGWNLNKIGFAATRMQRKQDLNSNGQTQLLESLLRKHMGCQRKLDGKQPNCTVFQATAGWVPPKMGM